MRLLTLRLLGLANVIGVSVHAPAPMHLSNWSLLLKNKICIAALTQALLLYNRVHGTILASMRHLHLLLV